MRKFILPILLFLMFIPLVVNAETCDTDKISISSIAIESKSDNVEELSEATVSGKSINLDLSMSNVGDYIEYKLVVKNDSNEDYELDKTSLKLNSDYIDYSFETDANSNVVKANTTKTVHLKVEYKNEVPEEQFESGRYNDNKTMTVQLSNGNTIDVPDTFKNPNTGVQSYILIIFILLLISGSLYVLLKKKKYVKFMILIIITAFIIPISVYALCKCNINIASNVQINYLKSSFCILDEDNNPVYVPINSGMTWNDLFSYANNNIDSRYVLEPYAIASYPPLKYYYKDEDEEYGIYFNDPNYYKSYRFIFENTFISWYSPKFYGSNPFEYHWEGIDSYYDKDGEFYGYSINSNLNNRIDESNSGICYCVACG